MAAEVASSNSSSSGTPSETPTFGPELWAQRRAEWLARERPSDEHATRRYPRSDDHKRLIELMKTPGADEDFDVWRSGLDKTWKSLVSGAVQKTPMPLATAIKVLRAGWLRDGTWPAGAAAPSSSEGEAAPPMLSTTPVFASQPTTAELETPRSGSASKLLSRLNM